MTEPLGIMRVGDRPRRVVVVAMKTQLRGRIRRTVSTLLEEGAEVTVIGLLSEKDFTVGLEHENLHVELLSPGSLYTWVGGRQRAQAERVRDRRDRRKNRTSGVRSAISARTQPWRERMRREPAEDEVEEPDEVEEDDPEDDWEEEESDPRIARISARVREISDQLTRSSNAEPDEFVVADQPQFDETLESSAGFDGKHHLRHLVWRSIRRVYWTKARPLYRFCRLKARRAVRRVVRFYVRVSRHLLRFALRTRLRVIWLLRRVRQLGIRTTRRIKRMPYRIRRSYRRGRARLRRRRGQKRIQRRQRIQRLRDRLRPWHRVTRYASFWNLSYRAALTYKPEFVASSDLPGLVGASRVARRLRVPHVHDCHELYLESTSVRPVERKLLAPVERRYMKRASGIAIVNESIRLEYHERYGVDGTVVRNCAEWAGENEGFDLYQLGSIAAEKRIVLYQGGFSVGRGLDLLIEAAADFPDDAVLVMLGYGPLEDELRDYAHSLGLGERVVFLEAVTPESLLATTATATVGIVPYQPVSENNRLALPNKIFEYTSVGLPVVVSRIPELERIAAAGCGEVYDPFDAADLARAVSAVLAPGQLEQYARRSKEWGLANSWDVERKTLLGIWEGALAGKRSDRVTAS